MLNKQILDAYECERLQMSQFKTRKFDVYRSANQTLTGQYFTQDRKPAFFELIVFDYGWDGHQFYLRYPETDYYVELRGHTGSSWGTMTECHLRNVVEEVINPYMYEGVLRKKNVTVYKHETEAIIMFGSATSGLNFLSRMVNPDINEIMSREYIPLPTYRAVHYSLVTPDNNYIIVDADDNIFTYEGMNCYYGNLHNGIKKGKISNFVRYRDGGTTLFDFELNGETYSFFYPTRLGSTDKVPTWNDAPLIEMGDDLKTLICSQLDITLAPQVAE